MTARQIRNLGPAWSAALRAGQDASQLRSSLMEAKSLQATLNAFGYLSATEDAVTVVKDVSAEGNCAPAGQ